MTMKSLSKMPQKTWTHTMVDVDEDPSDDEEQGKPSSKAEVSDDE